MGENLNKVLRLDSAAANVVLLVELSDNVVLLVELASGYGINLPYMVYC
jgi:hypothetical protein